MDKQFSKDEVADKVLEQYDDEQTRIFYQCVMGGGGHDIHFGIYKSPEDGVFKESSAYTTEWMMTQMDWANKITPDMHILDLGSGHGGGSHAMAQRPVQGDGLQPRPWAERAQHGALQGARHRSPGRRQGGQHQRAASGGMDRQVRRGVVLRGAVPRG